MVVYIDNDGDGKADETDFRHYRDGYLRYSWFSENHDGDGGTRLHAQELELCRAATISGTNFAATQKFT